MHYLYSISKLYAFPLYGIKNYFFVYIKYVIKFSISYAFRVTVS